MAEEKQKINHFLIPEHIKISEQEKSDLLKKYGITEKGLPLILSSDPGLISLDAKPGDVIKILRKSATKGVAEYYRVVIHG